MEGLIVAALTFILPFVLFLEFLALYQQICPNGKGDRHKM
jgi:hypothetical protein